MNFLRSKIELSISAALFSVLISQNTATAQSEDFSAESNVGQAANEFGETTYFDEYDSAVSDAGDGEDFMDRIDAIYQTVPESARVTVPVTRPKFNPAIFSLPDAERTFSILGGTIEAPMISPTLMIC